MIVFCWFLDLIFGTIEEKVRDRARSLAGRRSPAPPAIALVGLMGMLLGEKLWPMGRQLVSTWLS